MNGCRNILTEVLSECLEFYEDKNEIYETAPADIATMREAMLQIWIVLNESLRTNLINAFKALLENYIDSGREIAG